MSNPGHPPTADDTAEPDIYVVSDLHLGRGRNPESGRYHCLEAFFFDADFCRFCRFLCAEAEESGRGLVLVLNGDCVDLLRAESEPLRFSTLMGPAEDGTSDSPAAAARILRAVLAGHPEFVCGLAEILAAGHRLVLLPGNHDIGIQWTEVYGELSRALAVELGEDRADALERFEARSWFYHEPGRIWIEHGCQYDPENAFRFPLRRGMADEAAAAYVGRHDMPLGNFFQRYLYNGFGNITFVVPNSRANLRYMRWLLLNQPRLLLSVLVSHLPFAFQVLRRLSESVEPRRVDVRERHREAVAALAEESGLGDDLGQIDELKQVRFGLLQAVWSLGRQVVKTLSVAMLIALLSVGLWQVGSVAILEIQAGFGLKAGLFVALNFLALGAAAGTVLAVLLRSPSEPAPGPLRVAAQRIKRILNVPIVTFGHTHDETVVRLSRPSEAPAWYYNTGTWIGVFSHHVLLPRERVQYTFLRVRGTKGELLHWSPGRDQPLPVILLDDNRSPSVALAEAEPTPDDG